MINQVANSQSINSSKVYCKCFKSETVRLNSTVLIVAKCIVNSEVKIEANYTSIVLIVAKCIVNSDVSGFISKSSPVLIVAKCIVNFQNYRI